jgi:DNA polymerase III epsilon subunit family exonuclease
MVWLTIAVITVIVAVVFFFLAKRKRFVVRGQIHQPLSELAIDLSALPKWFVVFDLETTGLDPKDEIIEIGAILVNRDSDTHDTFQALVRPRNKITEESIKYNGITQEMVEKDGGSLKIALAQFLKFVDGHPLVAHNAEFDIKFLTAAVNKIQPGTQIKNRVFCSLEMARRAWRERKSEGKKYGLVDLAKDRGLSTEGAHRALKDCKLTMIIYAAAASTLSSTT